MFVPADSNIDGKYALSAFFLGQGPVVLINAQGCGLADGHSLSPLWYQNQWFHSVMTQTELNRGNKIRGLSTLIAIF